MAGTTTTLRKFCTDHALKIGSCLFLVVLAGSILLVGRPCACAEFPPTVLVAERIHGSEIAITQISGPGAGSWEAGQHPYRILVNGHDLSTMDSIRRGGYAGTIAPADGLSNREGSSVNLTGPELTADSPEGVRVVVLEEFSNRQVFTVCDRTV